MLAAQSDIKTGSGQITQLMQQNYNIGRIDKTIVDKLSRLGVMDGSYRPVLILPIPWRLLDVRRVWYSQEFRELYPRKTPCWFTDTRIWLKLNRVSTTGQPVACCCAEDDTDEWWFHIDAMTAFQKMILHALHHACAVTEEQKHAAEYLFKTRRNKSDWTIQYVNAL